jgi:hypothetical protein
MPDVKNQHFVPRLILRKFDERINTYNVNTKELKIDRKIDNVFKVNFAYSQEIEHLFSQKIENDFARILNDIILKSENEVILKRFQLECVKKFLVLQMLRTVDSREWLQVKREKLKKTVLISYQFEEKNTENLSNFDYWMRTLKSILNSKSLGEVINNPDATNASVYWSNLYKSSYLAIWDSSDSKEDFFVMDNGMTSEHEFTRFSPPWNSDAVKLGYIADKYNKSKENKKQAEFFMKYYFNIFLSLDSFTENFYSFSISKNRTLVLINPYFRLYDVSDYQYPSEAVFPDVWPTRITDRRLFAKNRNNYVHHGKTREVVLSRDIKLDDNDEYIYDIHQMKLDDVIYLNMLNLDRIQEVIGFSETSGIRRSIITYANSYNPRVDYKGLVSEMETLGYETKYTEKFKALADRFAPKYFVPSEKELYYANLFLEFREESKRMESNPEFVKMMKNKGIKL